MRGEILALHRKVNGTSIYVTHDQVEAMSLADIIYIMRDGKIVSSGSPKELYDNPPNLFTAGFLGFPAMNLLRGRISGDGFISENGTVLIVDWRENIKEKTSDNVTLGIRPDDIVVGDEGSLRGKIISLENLGRSVLLFVELEGGEKIRIQGEGVYSIGDMVSIGFSADRIFVYGDKGTLIN
jgi:ABC-type sugar transport system ATPase subunit